MYTIKLTKKVKADRNLCDHIWVEEVFLTKLGTILKAMFVRKDGEQFRIGGLSEDVVREYLSPVLKYDKASR